MIVVDTSALIAVLRREPEADAFLHIIAAADPCLVSAVSLIEAALVLAGRTGQRDAWTDLDGLVTAACMEVVPCDAAQVVLAREAFLRFGKGRHPAALNMGDCASYAVAASRGAKLLFKGNDFPFTDVRSAASS